MALFGRSDLSAGCEPAAISWLLIGQIQVVYGFDQREAKKSQQSTSLYGKTDSMLIKKTATEQSSLHDTDLRLYRNQVFPAYYYVLFDDVTKPTPIVKRLGLI